MVVEGRGRRGLRRVLGLVLGVFGLLREKVGSGLRVAVGVGSGGLLL